ncbi:glycosyltransferase [Lactiplantibacillus pingfangensis]|uniref:glycosyltransferase n=1 Tax=Lactiplantibacillus pingfangensis TaxID=2559915 RepID=UPI0010F9B64D|nr:glycosyltransferase [Lactiplantibacillus pingfangensis]
MSGLDVSVLISVYYKEKALFFQEALESIADQTQLPLQIVVVKDGPLTESLEITLRNFVDRYSDDFEVTVVSINTVRSLGYALNKGIQYCKAPLVARMDSDDHALPNRLELQTAFFATHHSVKIVGSVIQEFNTNWENVIDYRVVPTDPGQIKEFSKKRNPLNHMTVMFKKYFVQKIGGYREVPGFEDYDLWLRALQEDSAAIANISTPLVAARIVSLQKRRGGLKYIKQNYHARLYFLKEGLIDKRSFCVAVISATAVGISPAWLRQIIYNNLLRRGRV